MRLLVLSFYFYPDLCAGSFRTTALVSALRDEMPQGSTIEVVTTQPNRYASFSEKAPAEEQDGPVRIRRIELPAHQSDMLGQSKAFLKFARSAIRDIRDREFDVVFATSSRLLTAALGSFVSRRKRVPLYLDVRDIFVDTIGDVIDRRIAIPAKIVFSAVERYSMKRASTINLVSGGFEGYFQHRYPGKRYSWFTNGIDAEFLTKKIRPAKSLGSDSPTILYAGNIGEGQCLHDIVPRLAQQLHGRARILIIGDGGRRHQLEEAVKQAGVENVTLKPPVNRERLIAEYMAADVLFLHLGSYSAFEKVLPSKVFEYAAMGKPVLAGVAGYAGEFISREISNSAVFPPGDSERGLEAFSRLQLVDSPRSEFVAKYARSSISTAMAKDILELVEYDSV